ncbi:MAG: HEPN domain-containing protein [Planctomycetaceae bacterium]|nr:HEPN domain-containing protein [Planctomycetaceae bacterium]
MKRLTREWVAKAEADFHVADALQHTRPPVHDARCFHCQQSAEKYLKALLEELGATIPRTHNLEDLLALLLPHYPQLRSLRRGLIFLTDFAVETRYPGENANKRQAESAMRWATKVRAVIRQMLGLPA